MNYRNPESWRKVLSARLPGEPAQNTMAPEFRGPYAHADPPVEAAVLVMMVPHEEDDQLVFIRRNPYDGPHSAQVSFPGGAREPGDRSLAATAVREAREELGITAFPEILGSLTPLHIPVSNFLVTPFVCVMDHKPVYHPDPTEVQYVIEASLIHLADPENIRWDTWDHHGGVIRAPYYKVGNDRIWGATAMMLGEFLRLFSMMRQLPD